MPNNINESFEEEKNQSFDFRNEFRKIYSNWKLFSITLFVFFIVAFLFIRYATPIYKIQSSILIKDDSKSGALDNQDLVGQLDIFKKNKNLQNEIGVIKSKDLSRKTISDLGLYISYYYKSNKLKRKVEIYETCPFYILLDTSHIQLIETPIKISFTSKEDFSISIEENSPVSTYNFKYNTTNNKYSINQDLSKKLKIGDVFETNYLKFRILRRTNSDTSSFNDKDNHDFSFIIDNPQDVGGGYSNDLNVDPINKDATIVNLTIKTNLPQKATDYLNKLSENYINLDLEEKNLTAIKTIEFIDDQLSGISDSLNNIENVLENYRTKNQVMDISATAQDYLTKLSDLDKEKALTNIENKYYEYLINYIEKNKNFTDIIVPASIGIGDASINSLVTELITLSTEKSKITLSSTEKNPIYTSIINDLIKTKSVLLQNVQSALEITKINLKDIDQRIEIAESEINKLPKKERQLLDVQRKFNVSDATYSYLLTKKADAAIAKASNFSNNKMIDKAELIEQVFPKKKLIFLIAFILGLVLSYLFIRLKEYLNDTIQDRTDIESYTKLPILGIIAHSSYETNKLIVDNPRSMVAETIRSVKANIDFIALNKNSNIITISSTISNEGKSHTAINLACAYAKSEKNTVLIGADLRKPKIHKDFNLSNDIGLSTYLIGKANIDEIILKTDIDNLSVIPSGHVPPNPSELLGSKKMQELYNILRSKFEYIIIDTPPIGIVSDALSIMRYSDANIYVLRYNYTNKRVLEDLNDLIKTSGITNFCLILNDIYFKKNKYGRYYSKRYGYRYAYSYRYDDSYYTEET